jgi:hypothetical protein
MRAYPSWAKQEAADSYGNVACNSCGAIQSPHFVACIYCCNHDTLLLTEEWHGTDEGGGWELAAECASCGKNFGFENDYLISKYQLTRKPT